MNANENAGGWVRIVVALSGIPSSADPRDVRDFVLFRSRAVWPNTEVDEVVLPKRGASRRLRGRGLIALSVPTGFDTSEVGLVIGDGRLRGSTIEAELLDGVEPAIEPMRRRLAEMGE